MSKRITKYTQTAVKSLTIEAATWEKIKEIIGWKQFNYKNQSQVLGLMLKRFDNKEFKEVGDLTIGETKTCRVILEPEEWKIYEKIRTGIRAKLISELLRTWIKENS